MRRGTKAFKKFIVIVTCITLAVSGLYSLNKASKAAGSGDINFRASSTSDWYGNNTVNLNWNVSGKDIIYRIIRATDGDNNYKPLGLYNGIMPMQESENIRVLPVVPVDENGKGCDGANFLKDWGINGEYGIELLSPVYLTEGAFNTDADYYLKGNGYNASSPYIVDVIFFGAWDTNGKKDLSKDAYEKVIKFIKSGGSVLFAHDTVALGDDPANWGNVYSYFWKLANYDYRASSGEAQNKEKFLKPYSGYYTEDAKNKGLRLESNESNKVKMVKTGLLTSYPYNFKNIVDSNKRIVVANSHNTGQEALVASDRWFEFTDIGSAYSSYYGQYRSKKTSGGDATNFYLTTHGYNMGMIQSGHTIYEDSTGKHVSSTANEVMLAINTINYLGRHTSTSSYVDATATDVTGPVVSEPKASSQNGTVSVKISATDYGTTYNYKIQKYYKDANVETYDPLAESTKNVEVKASGVKDIKYAVDSNPIANIYTEFKSPEQQTDGNATITFPAGTTTQYLHIYAIDNNGNTSKEVLNYRIGGDASAPVVKIGESTLGENDVVEEEQLKDLEISDIAGNDELSSGIAGYAFTKTDENQPTVFVDDKSKIDFRKYGSGYRWLWAKDYAGNVTKVKVHIHSDLIYVDPKTGEHIEINDVIYDGVTMDQYYYGNTKIFY